MKAISSLYVKFREKISALFARRLQSIKGTSFLHLPHSKLRVKPLNFGGGGGKGRRRRCCISYNNDNVVH